jgi:hypothetical protein
VNESKDEIHINGDDVIKAIVKNITDGTEMIVDEFGRVNRKRQIIGVVSIDPSA